MPPRLSLQQFQLHFDDGPALEYAIGVPETADDVGSGGGLPLVMALHFGWKGDQSPRQGRDFLRLLPEPGLGELGAVLVAPTCPENTWNHPRSERAVLALLDDVVDKYPVAAEKVVLTGFSLGGMGTWLLAAEHPERFSVAIPVGAVPILQRGADAGAGRAEFHRVAAGGEVPWHEGLLGVPVYVINSCADELIPCAPVRNAVQQLRARGAEIEFVALEDVGHYESVEYVAALRESVAWIREVWSR